MKHLIVIAAGLGYKALEKRNLTQICGLNFSPAKSVFPAVTCTAQASLRTASEPHEHGMTSNGFYSRTLQKPFFWEQSAALVSGSRIWEPLKQNGGSVGLFFFQQSIGENVDAVISPAPIHKHGGGMIMRNYTQPPEMSEVLNSRCGTFPLHRYWGPLASPNVGNHVVKNFTTYCGICDVDYAFLYLPTLDYDLQRFGPDDARCEKSYKELIRNIKDLQKFASQRNADFTVIGDYEITKVTSAPAMPNVTLRKAGFFNIRPVASRSYPDFCSSRAFAMCDHEIAHVYVRNHEDIGKIKELFDSTNDYAYCEVRGNQNWAHKTAGELLLVAKSGSWCAYPWWTNPHEAPDYATHIDIHNKPGYDPCELYFGKLFPPGTSQEWSRILGTHGRTSEVAYASTSRLSGDHFITLAKNLLKA